MKNKIKMFWFRRTDTVKMCQMISNNNACILAWDRCMVPGFRCLRLCSKVCLKRKKNTEIQIHHIRFVILLLDHVLEIETILASPVKFFSRFFKDSFRCPIVSYFQLYLLKWRLCEGMSMQVYRY